MTSQDQESIIQEFHTFILDDSYPCVAARAAMSRNNIPCLVVDHMGCPKDDALILRFIYDFVARFRKAKKSLQSAAILFKEPGQTTPESFDRLFWKRLQALADLDAEKFSYDRRVSQNPADLDFSYSLAQEAFFVIGLHPGSSRRSRQFRYPTIVFNPHVQFEEMRKLNRYEKLKHIVRDRDTKYSGSVNPMLADFGSASEVFQYSGRVYDTDWVCPLKTKHGETPDHSAEK